MNNRVFVYSTQWCGDCRVAKRFLDSRNVSYTEIDIDGNPEAAKQVIEWSGGRRVIPTIAIQDPKKGETTILHNPPLKDLAIALGVN